MVVSVLLCCSSPPVEFPMFFVVGLTYSQKSVALIPQSPYAPAMNTAFRKCQYLFSCTYAVLRCL